MNEFLFTGAISVAIVAAERETIRWASSGKNIILSAPIMAHTGYRPHSFRRSFSGTGAAASDKLPGKLLLLVLLLQI